MTLASDVHCGRCSNFNIRKDAKRWYTDFKEGLCENCDNVHKNNKTSRRHNVISTENYCKVVNISISEVCEHHGEELDSYCKIHDKVLCTVCVSLDHKVCSDVIPISIASTNAIGSTALTDLEGLIKRTLLNLTQCINNRKFATMEIERDEWMIRKIILETRTKINGQLDKLQEKLLNELRSTSERCISKYTKFLQKMNSIEEKLIKLRDQTKHIKQFSSDRTVFLGTHQINTLVVNETESIKNSIVDTKDYKLTINLNTLIEKLTNEVKEFGRLKVSESTARLEFRDHKRDQAQISINYPIQINNSNIKLRLVKTITIQSKYIMNIKRCVILPNGNLLMTNFTEKKNLIEYRNIDKHIRNIAVSGLPYDIAVIDSNRIVVTYGGAKYLEIINSNTFSVEKKVRLEHPCYGASQNEEKLYVNSGNFTIEVLNISGKHLETMKIGRHGIYYIIKRRDRIFYIEEITNIFHCCSLNGDELWQFKADSLKSIYDVEVDNNHNVYVICYSSNNLTMIHNDGKHSQILLTGSEGLIRLRAVHYDREKDKIIICNEKGKIMVYTALTIRQTAV